MRGNSSQNQEENLPEDAPAEITDISCDNYKVEHVYLDERGKVIETATVVAPDQDNGTKAEGVKHGQKKKT